MSSTLLKDCMEFLESTGLESVKLYLEFYQNTLESKQLGAILHDGVILCDLLRLFKNEAITKKIDRRLNLSHVSIINCIRNITVFLEGCKNALGVPERYWFEVIDLSEFQDFEKVLQLLSYLSNTQRSRNLGLKSFKYVQDSIYNDSVDYVTLLEEEPEQFLSNQSVETIYATNIRFEQPNAFRQEETLQEILNTIGHDYVNIIPDKAVETGKLSKVEKTRKLVLLELLSSEKKHINTLNMIEKFSCDLSKYLTADEIKGLLFNMEEIKSIHEKFYDELKQIVDYTVQPIEFRQTNNMDVTLGSVFKKFKIEFANTYKLRLMFFDKVIDASAKIKRNSYTVDWNIIGLLTTPQYHVCNYGFILQRLLENSKEDISQADIEHAFNEASELAAFLDEFQKRVEHFHLLWNKCNSMPIDMEKYLCFGAIVWDGLVDVLEPSNFPKRSVTKCHVFLFETHILVFKKDEKKENYLFVCVYPLKDLGLKVEHAQNWAIFRFSNLVTIILEDRKQKQLVKILCSEKKRENIQTSIENIIKILKPTVDESNGHHPIPIVNPNVSECTCGKTIQTIGYHCDRCNNRYHINCLQNTSCICYMINHGWLKPDDLLRVTSITDGLILAQKISFTHEKQTILLQTKGSTLIEFNPNLGSSTDLQKPPRTSLLSKQVLNAETQNSMIESKLWFFGAINNVKADELLRGKAVGTFLVRFSVKRNEYILSLSADISGCATHITLSGNNAQFSIGVNERFGTIDDYIAYFRENHLGSCYTRNNVRNFLANVKLTSALIQTRVRARFGLIIPSGNDEIRIFPNDLITILSTNEEDAKGVWEVEINEKQCYLHWSLLCKFCDLEENIGNHNVSRSSVYSEAISETMSLP